MEKYNNEEEFKINLCKYLSQWFICEREVWSDCRKNRIDILLTEKTTGAVLALECKVPDDEDNSKRGKTIGSWIKQTIHYSTIKFKGYRVPFFIAPPISNDYLARAHKRIPTDGIEYIQDKHEKYHDHHTVNGLLGDLNIGEIRKKIHKEKEYFVFKFSNQTIFSTKPKWDNPKEIEGIHEGNYKKLIEKTSKWALNDF